MDDITKNYIDEQKSKVFNTKEYLSLSNQKKIEMCEMVIDWILEEINKIKKTNKKPDQ